MNFFIAGVPKKITLILKGAANNAQSDSKGVYILGPNQENGKSYWIQEGGSYALWFNKFWMFGKIENLGKNIAGINSPDDSVSPLEATNWNCYVGNDEWINASDLIILSELGIYLLLFHVEKSYILCTYVH